VAETLKSSLSGEHLKKKINSGLNMDHDKLIDSSIIPISGRWVGASFLGLQMFMTERKIRKVKRSRSRAGPYTGTNLVRMSCLFWHF